MEKMYWDERINKMREMRLELATLAIILDDK